MTDSRIPLRFAANAALPGPDLPGTDPVGARPAVAEAVLWEEGVGPPPASPVVARFRAAASHRPGCPCCAARGPAAMALAALFQDRARGRVPWFAAVVAVVRNPAAVAAELAADVVVTARFRFEAVADLNTRR
jgi:hypothetical protein